MLGEGYKPRTVVYCWLDTEYTDLDYNRAELLEIALIATDEKLEPIGSNPAGIPAHLLTEDGFVAFIKPPPPSKISKHVLDNYQDLLHKCDRYGIELKDADRYLSVYLEQFPESRAEDIKKRPVLAGNSIHADLFLVRKHLPSFAGLLNYRLLDVSSQKLEWWHHYGGEKFKKTGNPDLIQRFYTGRGVVRGDKHDAYFDVQASLAELAYYRAHLKMGSGVKK